MGTDEKTSGLGRKRFAQKLSMEAAWLSGSFLTLSQAFPSFMGSIPLSVDILHTRQMSGAEVDGTLGF